MDSHSRDDPAPELPNRAALSPLRPGPGGSPRPARLGNSFIMNRSTVASRSNLELIDEQYRRWRDDPGSVDETWRVFFEGFELGGAGAGGLGTSAAGDMDAARAQVAVTRLIDAYREVGHYMADLDP